MLFGTDKSLIDFDIKSENTTKDTWPNRPNIILNEESMLFSRLFGTKTFTPCFKIFFTLYFFDEEKCLKKCFISSNPKITEIIAPIE